MELSIIIIVYLKGNNIIITSYEVLSISQAVLNSTLFSLLLSIASLSISIILIWEALRLRILRNLFKNYYPIVAVKSPKLTYKPHLPRNQATFWNAGNFLGCWEL